MNNCTYHNIKTGEVLTEKQLLNKFNSNVERQKEAIEWLKENTNTTDNDILPIVSGLLSNGSLGRMLEDGKLLFTTLTPDSVIYHEAFHRVFNFFATQEERISLLEDFENDPNSSKRLLELQNLYNSVERVAKRGFVLSKEDLIEEALSEEFQEYKIHQDTQNKTKNNIFSKMLNFIRDLFNLGKKLENKSYRYTFYQKIIDGQFKQTPKITGKIEQYKDSLNDTSEAGTTVEQTIDFIQNLNANFIENLIKKDKIQELLDGKLDYLVYFREAYRSTILSLKKINPELSFAIGANIRSIRERHLLLLKDYNIITEDVENFTDFLFSDEKTKDTEFNKNSIEFDPRASIKKSARLILSTLESTEKNSIGLNSIVPYKEVNNILLKNLSNVPLDIEEFLYKISTLELKYPYLSKLKTLLQNSSLKFKGDFIDSFSNTHLNFDLIAGISNNLKVIGAATSANRNIIVNEWKLKLLNNINTNPKILEDLLDSKKSSKDFWNLLGIEGFDYVNHGADKYTIVKTMEELKITDPNKLLTIFDVQDKTWVVKGRSGKDRNLSYIFSDLAVKFSKKRDDLDIMIFNADKKPVYPITQYSFLTATVGWMNHYRDRFYADSSIKEEFETLEQYLENKMPHIFNVQTRNSTFLNSFLDNGDLSVNLFSGFNVLDQNIEFKNAEDPDYYTAALKLFLETGQTFSLTQGDRQIFPTFKTSNLINSIDSMVYYYKGYIKDEYHKIKLLEKSSTKINNLSKNPEDTIIDPEIFNLKKALKAPDIDIYLESITDQLRDSISDFITKNVEEYYNIFTNDLELNLKNIIDLNNNPDYSTIKEAVRFWFMNQYISNIEQYKLFYGDISLFGNYSKLWKRLNTPTSTGTPGNISQEVFDHLDNLDTRDSFEVNGEVFNYLEKRQEAGVSSNTIKEQILLDKETSSIQLEDIKAITKNYYTKIYSKFPYQERYEKNKNKIDKEEGETILEKLINWEVNKDTASYNKINEADGFSYLNLFEWRRVMTTMKLWSDKHDKLFARELEVLKISMDNSLTNEDKELKINKLFSTENIDVEDYFQEHEQASLLKPQYSGPVYDRPYNQYMEQPSSERLNIYGVRKTSFMPLLPSVIFGTDLAILQDKMLKSGTGIAPFDSAAKVGAVNKDYMHSIDDIVSTEENQFINPDATFISYQFLKNQVYIKPQEKKSIIDSTQSRKNIIIDKYHQNVPFDYIFSQEGSFNTIKEKWNALSEVEKLKQSPLHSTVEDYLKALNDIISRNTQILLKELEVKPLDNDFNEFEIQNINNIIKILQKQARDRNSTLDVLEAFQYLLDNEETLFNVFPNPTKLQSIITSIISSNVIKLKRLGNDYAQVSPVFWEQSDSKRLNSNKSNSEVLKFYSKDLKPAEIMIPAPIDLLKKLEKTLEDPEKYPEINKIHDKIKDKYPDGFNLKKLTDLLNELISEGYLDSEVTFKGLRIPNQELSSNEIVKVKNFLMPTMSKLVVINAETVAKTGSDFDIDKMNIYFKYLNKDLKTIEYTTETTEEATRERFKLNSQEKLTELFDLILDKDISDITKEISKYQESMANLKKEYKEDLEEFSELKSLSKEAYNNYITEVKKIISDIKDDLINYNTENYPFSLQMDNSDIELLSSVQSYKELNNFLYSLKNKKELELGQNFIELREQKNQAQIDLNTFYETIKYKGDPFKNSEFRKLHSEYKLKSKELESYLEKNGNENKLKNVKNLLLQLNSLFESLEDKKTNLVELTAQKNEISQDLIEDFFEPFKTFKEKKEMLEDIELEYFKQLPIEYQNPMGALYNRLSQLEEKLILNENVFAQLLHPIGDGGLKELLLDKIEKVQNKDERFSIRENKSLQESLLPKNNLIKKKDLKEAEIGIGQLASQLTHHAVGKNIILNQTYISQKYDVELPTKIFFEGYSDNFSMDNYFTDDMENIVQSISGHLTTQVDAASDPYAVYLNIKVSTAPIITFLLRRGVPKDIIYSFMTQPKVLEFIFKSSVYKSLSYKFSNEEMFNKFYSPNTIAFKKIFNIPKTDKTKLKDNITKISEISPKDLNTPSKRKDEDFQKNLVNYYILLSDQAKTFNNIRKLMSSDTIFHKSLSSYKSLMNLEVLTENTQMFKDGVNPLLTSGFIAPFYTASKLFYNPWKPFFLSTRDVGSNIGGYINYYSEAIAESLSIPKTDLERRAGIVNSMERQFIAFLQEKFGRKQDLDIPNALIFMQKHFKPLNVSKLFSVMLDYGITNKQNVVQSKVKNFTVSEINNYLLLMKKISKENQLDVGHYENITGEEFFIEMFLQHLKQTKNDFSPFAIDQLIPGNISTKILSELIRKFSQNEQNNFETLFAEFILQFQLNNKKFVGYSDWGGILIRKTQKEGIYEDLNGAKLVSKYYPYHSDFSSEVSTVVPIFDEISEDFEDSPDFIGYADSYGNMIEREYSETEIQLTNRLELSTLELNPKTILDITKNHIKNLYKIDPISRDTVNGQKSYINKSLLLFENDNVYLLPNLVILNGKEAQLKKTKIGNYSVSNGNIQMQIDFSKAYRNIRNNSLKNPIVLNNTTPKNSSLNIELSNTLLDEWKTLPVYSDRGVNTMRTENRKEDLSLFTNHSGGAKGYDAEWDIIGEEYGMVNNKHYLLPEDGEVSDERLRSKGVKPVNATRHVGNVAKTGTATGEAQIAVTQAEKLMGRIESNHTTRNTKKIRNYAQVKNADGIFAIGSLIPKGADITIARGQTVKKALVPQVNGGTSVAVQLGIMQNKPTYVFNQVANDTYSQGWYKWDNQQQDFISIEVPTLTKNFAGIGTSSNTTEQGKQAIRDVYEKTSKYKEFAHFGNPWSEGGYQGTIKVGSVQEAIKNYKDWLLGNSNQNVKSEQRSWILDQINSGKLDNATLLYSKKLSDRGLGSHAEALKEVIELLRGNEFDTGLSTESFACEKK